MLRPNSFFQSVLAVIASLLQRLTLIAFTVHAVLSCCLHRSHATGHSCSADQASVSCESSHDHDGHRRDPAVIASIVAQHDSLFVAVCCECTPEHSSPCDEAPCSFVPAVPRSFEFEFEFGFDLSNDQTAFENNTTFSTVRFHGYRSQGDCTGIYQLKITFSV